MGLDTSEIIISVEDRFNIAISDTEAEAMHTVGDVVAHVVRRLAMDTHGVHDLSAHSAIEHVNSGVRGVVSRQVVEDEVRHIVADVIGLPLDRVQLESHFVRDLGAD